MVIMYILMFFVIVVVYATATNWGYYKITDYFTKNYGELVSNIMGVTFLIASVLFAGFLFKLLV